MVGQKKLEQMGGFVVHSLNNYDFFVHIFLRCILAATFSGRRGGFRFCLVLNDIVSGISKQHMSVT